MQGTIIYVKMRRKLAIALLVVQFSRQTTYVLYSQSHLGWQFWMLFQSSKLKAQMSLFTETWQKRRSSIELWAFENVNPSGIGCTLTWRFTFLVPFPETRLFNLSYTIFKIVLNCFLVPSYWKIPETCPQVFGLECCVRTNTQGVHLNSDSTQVTVVCPTVLQIIVVCCAASEWNEVDPNYMASERLFEATEWIFSTSSWPLPFCYTRISRRGQI